MGSGNWDTNTFAARGAAKAAAGKPTFAHDDHVRRTGVIKVHDDLDPKRVNTAGIVIREAFDSDEHPNSTPIAVCFDVTGSMRELPKAMQQKFPQLHGVLQRRGYVSDPQLLFAAVGDAYSDQVPLQIGQFESDNRQDEQLECFYLEGGGGGGNHESYQLFAYFMARHAELDSVKKRGKKGYLFIIGDERVYDKIDRRQVEEIFGERLQEDIPTTQIFAELREKFEVFFLFAAQGSYQPEGVMYAGGGLGSDGAGVCYWRDLLGQNAIILEDADAVCETIALTIGLMEGVVDLDEGAEHLLESGADRSSVDSATKALATVGAGASSVAKADGAVGVSNDPDTASTV